MFKNYLKIAWRNLLRKKSFALLNIFGLAFALACCILIYFFIRHEWSYDRFHKNGRRIYRVLSTGGEEDWASTPMPLAQAIKSIFPEIKQTVRLQQYHGFVSANGNVFNERMTFVSAAFFEVFSFNLLKGDTASALKDKFSIVLSREMAEKYFGGADPIGKSVEVGRGDLKQAFTVAGVLAPIPANSSLQFDFLLPLETMKIFMSDMVIESWGVFTTSTFVELWPNAQAHALEKKVSDWGLSRENEQFPRAYRLQPMTNIHMGGAAYEDLYRVSSRTYSYILSFIAVFILLIACLNYVLLSLGQALPRIRSYVLYRVIGAPRLEIVRQLWMETLLVTLIAFALGMGLAELGLPFFNRLADIQFEMPYFRNPQFTLFYGGLILFASLLSGGVPALILMRCQISETIKNRLKLAFGGRRWTTIPILAQFAISGVLICCTVTMLQQVKYFNDKELGFETKNILVLRTHNFSSERVAQIIRVLRTELSSTFDLMSSSARELGIGELGASTVITLDNGEWKLPEVIHVDEHFFRFLQIGKVDNMNWQNLPVQPDQVLVNQALVDEFGFQEPMGKILRIREKNYSIAGVVPDFHFEALYHRIKPAIFFIDPANADGSIFVKFAAGQSAPGLELLKEKWREIAADLPFDYYFLDEALAAQYANEARWTKMISIAAMLAILIACIGLLGLAAFTIEQRTKEIGVRKVLGATVANIVSLLSTDLMKLVLLANLIAWPAAWLAMTLWLRNFAYRVDIAWWLFVLTGGLSVGLALVTVSTQTIKAALANPVEALRYE